MAGGRERVIEIGGQPISRDGWSVAVRYDGQDGAPKWGVFSHSQKGRARAVYTNLSAHARECRIYRRGKEVARMTNALQIDVASDADFERFLKD